MNLQISDSFKSWGGSRARGTAEAHVDPDNDLRFARDFMEAKPERYERRRRAAARLTGAILVVARLGLAVGGLLLALAAAYLYRNAPVTWLDDYFLQVGLLPISPWLTWGHVLLPASFFVVVLTNRSYGPGYALAQVLMASVLVAAMGANLGAYADFGAAQALDSTRQLLALQLALFFALVASVISFDAARHLPWFCAPLAGFLAGAMVFAVLFYPMAYVGREPLWLNHMEIHLGIMGVLAVLLLIPYGMVAALEHSVSRPERA